MIDHEQASPGATLAQLDVTITAIRARLAAAGERASAAAERHGRAIVAWSADQPHDFLMPLASRAAIELGEAIRARQEADVEVTSLQRHVAHLRRLQAEWSEHPPVLVDGTPSGAGALKLLGAGGGVAAPGVVVAADASPGGHAIPEAAPAAERRQARGWFSW